MRFGRHNQVYSHPVIARLNNAKREEKLPKQPRLEDEYDLRTFDGIRVLGCFAILCFHAFLYWGALLPTDTGYKVCVIYIQTVKNCIDVILRYFSS
jgi:hypothetical protein